MAHNFKNLKLAQNNANLPEKSINFTTMQSQDVTEIHHSNNYNELQYFQNNDEVCITDRSNSNIFNLSSHDSQSFLNSPGKKKQNFRNDQKWMKETYSNQTKQNNFFQNSFTSQNKNLFENNYKTTSDENKLFSRQKHQHANKYYQFAFKISKLFNINFDNLENLYNQIKQQISSKRKQQNEIQQENTFQQSDIMKKLFSYAMKIKSGHNQLKDILSVIDKKSTTAVLQKQYENSKTKYLNDIQENVSIKIQDVQEKTKRFFNQKQQNKERNRQIQNKNVYLSQNLINNQNIDSVQTINTIPIKNKSYQNYIYSNQQIIQNKDKSNSSRKTKYSQKLHLIALQLQTIKSQIQNQDANLENKNQDANLVNKNQDQNLVNKNQHTNLVYKNQYANLVYKNQYANLVNKNQDANSEVKYSQKPESEIQLNLSKSQFVKNQIVQQQNINSSFSLLKTNFNKKINTQNTIQIKANISEQLKKQQSCFKYQLSNKKTNDLFLHSQINVGNPQKTVSKINSSQQKNYDFRSQKSYTYINSLEQLPQQNDEVSQKIHQVIIKSIRSPSKQPKQHTNIVNYKSKNDEKNYNQSQGFKISNKEQQTQNISHQKNTYNQYQRFLQKKQPFSFSKSRKKQNFAQKSEDNKKKQFFKSKNKKELNKKENKVYLSQQDIASQQGQNNLRRKLNLNQNSRSSFKTNSSLNKSNVNIKYQNREVFIQKKSSPNIEYHKSNYPVINTDLNIQNNQNINQKSSFINETYQRSQRYLGQKLSSIYSVQTIPSIVQIQQNKKLQNKIISIPKNVKEMFSRISQSSNQIIIRPKSVQDPNYNKKISQQRRSFIYNMNPISSRIISHNKIQPNLERLNNIFRKQQPRYNFRNINPSFVNLNQQINTSNEYKPVERYHNSLSLRHDNKNVNVISPNKRIIVALKPDLKVNQQMRVMKNQWNNQSFRHINNKIIVTQKDKKNLNNSKDQSKQVLICDTISQNSMVNKSSIQNLTSNKIQQKTQSFRIQSSNIQLKISPKINNSAINNIPQNLKPPKYIPPKNISQNEPSMKESKKQLSLKKDESNYRPIKTYTQGHLLNMQQSKSIQKYNQKGNHNINESIKNLQNRMLQSQVQYRHDLMEKSTPSFGLQSSHQFLAKSQILKTKQLNSSRSKSNKKGISLSSRKQKMYNSNFS